jgi:hypothetical protein
VGGGPAPQSVCGGGKGRPEGVALRRGLQPLEVPARVAHEVESSSEMPACSTPHIASRKSDMKRISRRVGQLVRPRLAEVPPSSMRSCAGIELMVDGDVRQVEKAIAHARVLPVDDPHAVRGR